MGLGEPAYRDRMSNEKIAAVQAVVDRVSSYQETAPDGTVEKELRSGLDEAGVGLDDAAVTRLVDAIEADPGAVDAAAVLG